MGFGSTSFQWLQQHICCQHCWNRTSAWMFSTALAPWMDNRSVHLSSSWGGRWRLSSSFPGYFQCLSNAARSLFDSQMWTKTVWICRRRGVRAFPWYHSLGPPVFLCSPAVFFSVPPAVLSWPSFFSCFHPRTPAALSRNPLTSLHSFKKTSSCIHSGMPASVLCSNQPVPPALPSLGSPVSVDLQLFQVALQLTVSSLQTPMSLFCSNIPFELLLGLFFKGGVCEKTFS